MEIPPSLSTLKPKKADLLDQYRWYILSGLAVILSIGIYLMFVPPQIALSPGADVMVAGDTASVSGLVDSKADTIYTGQIVVDVAGAIQQPGVYHIANGSIIEDAITAAGGFSNQADMNAVAHQINRAEELTDHGKIYIPKKGESVASIVYTNPTPSSSTTPPANQTKTKININTASGVELEILPTIGPILSQRIVDYRIQNGSFGSIEDIKNVNGISDSRFDQFKDLITI
jgi:competence protein ComEA